MTAATLPVSPAPAAPDTGWLTSSERGSVLGIRLLFFVCVIFGRRAVQLVLRPVTLYFVLTQAAVRRASRDYLERVLPKVTFATLYRHQLTFAEVLVDSIFLLKGQLHYFKHRSRQGFEYLEALRDAKRGALLVGAHLGNVEAMRVLAGARSLPLYVVVYTGNARMINALLKTLSPELAGRVIEITPGSVDSMLRVKELIDAGQIVALLGDRVGVNEKSATVQFLGGRARLPTGVYVLASLLKCPVYLTFGIYTSPNEYDFFCEPFVDGKLDLPRQNREAALEALAQRYALRLEHYCRLAPLNWFNFYDFWSPA